MARLIVTTARDETADGPDLAADAADGEGLSLREALHWAEAGDEIAFHPSLGGAVLVLVNGRIGVDVSVTVLGDIDGDGRADVTLSGDHDRDGSNGADEDGIFGVSGGATLALDALTLDGGTGGLVRVEAGATLSVSGSAFLNGDAAEGGAILSHGTLSIDGALFAGNAADRGGAIHATGTTAISGTTFAGNTAAEAGGAVFARDTALTLTASTVSGNAVDSAGVGGGVYLSGSSNLVLENTVLAGNLSGAAVDDLANPGGASVWAGYSFLGSGVGAFTGGPPNVTGDAPGLGPLADAGGPVPVRSPLDGSPLIDAGGGALGSVDATGAARHVGAAPDIGAVERQLIVTTIADEAAGGSFAADLADGGGLSLREAIAHAADGQTVRFAPMLFGETLVLTRGALVPTADLTLIGDIDGDGRADVTLSGDADGSGGASTGDSRILAVIGDVSVTLAGLTLERGYGYEGGAVMVGAGATLTLADSTLRDSVAGTGGGAVMVDGGRFIASGVTIEGNSAGLVGGGILATGAGAETVLSNVTLTANHAGAYGGGIAAYGAGPDAAPNRIDGTHVTLAGNTASEDGSQIYAVHADVLLKNTLIAGPLGMALSETGPGGSLRLESSLQVLGEAVTGPLADNGGPVETMMPLPTGPLVDAGSGALAAGLATDAAGGARVVGDGVDIGAAEYRLQVTTLADEAAGTSLAEDLMDGDGLSLREALAHARDGDVIGFGASLAGGTLVLSGGALTLAADVTVSGDIDGDRRADIVLDAVGAGRIFETVEGVEATLAALQLVNGRAAEGGAILVVPGSGLVLRDSIVAGSAATGSGGAILTAGELTLDTVLLYANAAGTSGGAVHQTGGTLTVTNSLVDGNRAETGGGIALSGGTLELRNSTLFGNGADAAGGGLHAGGGVGLIINAILAGNTGGVDGAGDDLAASAGADLRAAHTVLGAGSAPFTDLGGTILSSGDIGLGALADLGGAVPGRPLMPGSGAIGAGDALLLRVDRFDADADGVHLESLPLDAAGGVRVRDTLDAGAVEHVADMVLKGRDAFAFFGADETLAGAGGDDVLSGLGGDDVLIGGAGNDTLHGGQGDDSIDGGAGADRMDGGPGNDRFIVDDPGDVVIGGDGRDTVIASVSFTLPTDVEDLVLVGDARVGRGNALANHMTGNAAANVLIGNGGNDRIFGEGGNDHVRGGSGNDRLYGGKGRDLLDGGSGNDRLYGGPGRDVLKGGAGNDRLDGGPGRDTAVFAKKISAYRIKEKKNGDLIVIAKKGNEGKDRLTDIELLEFRGKTVKLKKLQKALDAGSGRDRRDAPEEDGRPDGDRPGGEGWGARPSDASGFVIGPVENPALWRSWDEDGDGLSGTVDHFDFLL